jgi:DNA polymerase-3 subunit delta'
MGTVDRATIPALAKAHAELSRLAAQAPTYNYDPGLLVMEIGSLLAALGAPSDRAHG